MDTKVSQEKALYGIEENIGRGAEGIGRSSGIKILEGHLMIDHVHVLIEIPPQYSVAQVVGYSKGKSAIHIARTYEGRQKNFTGQHFWARGYFVTIVGRDETVIREYIRNQENDDKRQDHLDLMAE